jgi:lactoylglutathione lyase
MRKTVLGRSIPAAACTALAYLLFFDCLSSASPHEEYTMARIQHLAIASRDPYAQAEFYKRVLGFTEVKRLDNPRAKGVVLTDGHLNISVLQFQQDQLDHGLDFTGLHHFGVYVEDLDGTAKKCLENGCVPYSELPEDPDEKAKNYRPKRSDKFKGPENALFDIADHAWIGAGSSLTP